MFFGRSEHKRANPYVILAIGGLAMVGAITLTRCARNTVRSVKNKVKCTFRGTDVNECPIGE